MREDHDAIVDADGIERDVLDMAVGAAVRGRGHTFRECLQHRRGPAHGVMFERFAAREHQHHEGAGEVFAEQHRGDDRDPGQQVGAELARDRLACEIPDEWRAAGGEHHEERQIARQAAGPERPRHEMCRDPRHREHGNGRLPVPDGGEGSGAHGTHLSMARPGRAGGDGRRLAL